MTPAVVIRPLVCLLLLVAPVSLRSAPPSAVPEPPLPGEDGPVPSGEAFEMLPLPGEAPPESQVAPPTEPPTTPPTAPVPPAGAIYDQMPDLPPLGLPSDGEAMPDLPSAPGLVAPDPSATRADMPPGTPAAPGSPDASLPQDPVPDDPAMSLARKAYWHPSPMAARKASVASGKPLLLFFASKWDGQCPAVDLVDDLFSQSEFSEYASDHLVLATIFEPVGSPPKSFTRERMAAIRRFKEYFKVQSFPTVVILDDKGRELERIKGYARHRTWQKVGKEVKQGPAYSTAHQVMQRIRDAVQRHEAAMQRVRERQDWLRSQGFRVWHSRTGSSLLARLVEARPDRITLIDEKNRLWRVRPPQLILFDAEWARRKQAGLLPPPRAATPGVDTAAVGP